jgi:Terminase small subunit
VELHNSQHEAFAQHVAAGLSLTASARKAEYKESAAANMGSRLLKHPKISERIQELKAIHGEMAKRAHVAQGIRNPLARVSALEDRWSRMLNVINERAADPEMQTVPGGKSGLLCMTYKQLGSGVHATVVREFKVDTALLCELREHEQQAAEELGQRSKRVETYNQSFKTTLTLPELKEALQSRIDSLPADVRAEIAGEVLEATKGDA